MKAPSEEVVINIQMMVSWASEHGLGDEGKGSVEKINFEIAWIWKK